MTGPLQVRPGRRGRLSVQLIVFEILLIAVVLGGAFLALSVEIRAITKRFFVAELRRTQRELLSLQQRSLEQLVWTSGVVTESPTLRAAIEIYRVESLSGHSPRAQLLGTIQREVERIVSGLGRDLVVVTDERGRVLAASERGAARPTTGEDLTKLPVVRRALDPTLPTNGSNFGVARFRGEYFQLGGVPIVLQDVPIGSLLLGERLDTRFLAHLRESFDGELVVAGGGRVLGTTLRFLTDMPLPDSAGTMNIRGEEYVAAPLPLGADSTGAPVTLYLLDQLSSVLGPLESALRLNFIVYGLLALILGVLGAVVASRSLTAPLRGFVEFMESVARSGDYSQRFNAGDAAAEIRTLDSSYGRLIESLEQKHRELEQRTAELSRTNLELTEQMRERERAEQALHASEAQLRQSQKLEAIGTLAGGIAHDFNNLLTVIQSYTELVLDGMAPRTTAREDLEQVKQAALRASALTKQLLAFSRKQVLQPKVLDLNAVVAGVEKMLRRVIGEDIDLKTVGAPALARVQADPSQLEQVIMNLAVNARDAMPRGGRLTIATANVHLDPDHPDLTDTMPPGNWVLLSVTDTGMGMDDTTKARIFEPFFTTKEAGKGTGLGLSTVYGIVKQSGGFISLTSELRLGTTFKIYLPALPAIAEVSESPGFSTRSGTGSETVLVTEDEGPVRQLACRCLEEHGYRVLAASGPADAERIADGHVGPIHLLLTDVVMPGMGGRELSERLLTRRPEMRVLFMSGYTDGAVEQHGALAEGIQLLEKPFSPLTLAQRVREVLDARRVTA